MRIVGIDPGSNATGYGFVDIHAHRLVLVEAGTIEPKKSSPIHIRIHKIYSVLEELIREHKPEVLVLEKLYAHHKHPATSAVLGHVRGVICLLCAQYNIELVEHSVKRIRKSVTGNGNATKQQTKKVVAHMLNVDENKLTLDASDALALALGYCHLNRLNL